MGERGHLHEDVATIEREAIAESVMHEIMLHLPDADREQATEVGWSILPRIISDHGAATLIATAERLSDAMRPEQEPAWVRAATEWIEAHTDPGPRRSHALVFIQRAEQVATRA